MIDQNTKNICHLIKQSFVRLKKTFSLSDIQSQELAIAFTFLRRVDCLIEQYNEACSVFYNENKEKLSDKQLDKKLREITGGKPFYNVSGYNFTGLLNSGLSVEVAVMSYVQGLSSNVRQILKDMDFAGNVAILMRQSKYLVELFDFYLNIDLSISAISNKQFIDLITTLALDGSRNSELYPTPIGLSKLICECLFCKEVCEGLFYDDPFDGMSIYDPVCGTGSLLAYAGEQAKILTEYEKDVYLIGQETSPFPCAIANALILLTGDEDSFADNVNTLTEEESYEREYKFVVGDLPLGLPWTPFKERVERESMKEKSRFSKGLPGTSDSQFLFIQDIVSKMDYLGGRAAFISSGSVLQSGSVKSGESRIRRWLFESGLVETIIALPAGILSPYTNIPIYIWILSCCNDNYGNDYWEKMDGKVRLIDATKLVSSNKAFYINDEFIDSVVKEYKSLEDTTATRIVNKNDFGFYEVNLKEGSKKETVKISLDTNIHEYIEKERKPYAKGEIIIEFSSVEKGYSVDFSQFFKPDTAQIPSLKEESDKMFPVIDAVASLKSEIKSLEKVLEGLSPTETWEEIPLRAAIEFLPTTYKSEGHGLPIFTLAYLKAYQNGGYADVKFDIDNARYKLVEANDVIFAKSGASAGEIFNFAPGMMIVPSLEIIRCTNSSILCPNYLYYLLKGYEKSFKLLSKGSSVKNIDLNSILDFKCLIPSVEDQKKIVVFLDCIIGKLDNIIKGLNSSDNVFIQYRQTLIENIIRGKM